MRFMRLPGLTGNPVTAEVRLQQLPPRPPQVLSARDAMTRACHILAERHDDPWTALTGFFFNFRRTDLLVAGPLGVVAIRFGYASDVLVAAETNWQLRFTHFEGPRHLLDLVLAPPAVLNAAADELQTALRSLVRINHVVRAVILVDPAVRLDLIRPPVVDFVGRPEEFNAAALCEQLQAVPRKLGPYEAADAVCRVHMSYVTGGARQRAQR